MTTAPEAPLSRAQQRNVALFAVSLVTAGVVLFRPAWCLVWLRYGTYVTLVVLTGAWLARSLTWARARWSSPRDVIRANGPEILLALAATAALFLTHDWAFKVLHDETDMVATGRSLAFERRFDVASSSELYFGSHHFWGYGFDKRPPLFMFVLSLVDTALGYRIKNVWFLNGALFAGTLVVVGGALRRRVGRPWNLVCVGWAIANPIVMQTASAAGVEPLLCLMWALAGVLLLETLEKPESPSAPLLLATVALILLARVEAGPMAVLMLAGAVVFAPDRAKVARRLGDDWLLWCAPLVALPVVIQRIHLPGVYEGGAKPFDLRYVIANVANWRTVLTEGGKYYPFNAVVTVVEVLALFAVVMAVLSDRRMSKAEKTAFWAFALPTAAFFAIYSAYFWGQPNKSPSARFYALPFFFAGIAVPLVARRVKAIAARPDVAIVISGLVFAYAFPAAHNRAFGNSTSLVKEHKIVADLLRSRSPGHSILVVADTPVDYYIYDVGAVSIATFNAKREAVLRELESHLYDEVYVVQDVALATGDVVRGQELRPAIDTETVVTEQIDPSAAVRISRVTARAPLGPYAPTASDPPPKKKRGAHPKAEPASPSEPPSDSSNTPSNEPPSNEPPSTEPSSTP